MSQRTAVASHTVLCALAKDGQFGASVDPTAASYFSHSDHREPKVSISCPKKATEAPHPSFDASILMRTKFVTCMSK